MYFAICALVFIVAYLVNMTTITVLYHRGLAHQAVELPRWLVRFVAVTGNWLTGLDPKAWVCMHRLHHAHSDTKRDPHSPVNDGIFGLLFSQLKSYERIIIGLSNNKEKYTSVVRDIDMDISWLNKKRLWYLPYLLHLSIGLVLGMAGGWWLLGACYFVGIMGHPIQGWMVNSFGHAIGGRNFDTDDNSRNNLVVALLVMGEGLQNNHHQYPSSPRFAYRWFEPDFGWHLCRAMELFRIIKINRNKLMPSAREQERTAAA